MRRLFAGRLVFITGVIVVVMSVLFASPASRPHSHWWSRTATCFFWRPGPQYFPWNWIGRAVQFEPGTVGGTRLARLACDRLLRPRRDPRGHLDTLERRSAADRGARRPRRGGRPRPRRDARAGWGAVALMVVVFVSPLCALSSALFSARVLHHVLLIAVVAPLLALAFPLRATWLAAARRPRRCARGDPVVVACAGAYTWGLASVPAYWVMQTDAAWQRLDDVAGHPRAVDAAGCGAGRAGGDHRADGPARRGDRVRAQAALRACISPAPTRGGSIRCPTSSWPAC